MKKKNNKKGFTLAELLIVVAIIAVLTAIAIPVFTSQLEKSREATDAANVRDAYAEVAASLVAGELTAANDTVHVLSNLDAAATFDDVGFITSVEISEFPGAQRQSGWQGPAPTIAGYPMEDEDWDATKDSGTLTFTFELDAENDPYVTAIAFA